MTAETAVQIALLNNRRLQADFEEMGIAQADLAYRVKIAYYTLQAAQQILALQRLRAYGLVLVRQGILSNLEAGIITEHELDGVNVTGPTFQMDLPIFDQHQAGIVRAEARWRESQKRLSAMEMAVRSEVRLARAELLKMRYTAEFYRVRLLPLRRQMVKLTLRPAASGVKETGGFFEARESELLAQIEGSRALRDYWKARAKLERPAGGRLPIGP